MNTIGSEDIPLTTRCQNAAVWLHERKLAEPARILIELHEPLRGLGSAAATIVAPFVGIVGAAGFWSTVCWFLETPERVQALLHALEEKPS